MSKLFLGCLHTSLSAGWLVLLVVCLRLILHKAPKWTHLLLWAVVALRLMIPAPLELPFSFPTTSTPGSAAMEDWLDDYVGDVEIIHDDSELYDAAVSAGRIPISAGEDGYYVVTAPDQRSEPATVQNTVVPVLAMFWACGVVVLAGYVAISDWRLRRKMATSVVLRDNIRQSDQISTPFVLGLVRPTIYLPFHLDESTLPHVLAHEQTHIRRGDPWWKALGFLLVCVYWFHPLLWVAYALLCRDLELACDEAVIRSMAPTQRADYSQALLTCSVSNRFHFADPLAFGEVGVKDRVQHVLSYKKPTFWFVLVALVACTGLAVGFLTTSQAPTAQNSQPPEELSNLYVGDAPRVSALAQALPYPKEYSYHSLALQTAQEPYGMTVYLKQTESSRESLRTCAETAFDRISNLGTLTFLVQDAQGAQTRLVCYQRENTQLTKELTDQQLLLTFSQGIQESGYTITDWVFATDGAYDLDGVVEYTDDNGLPWNLAFIRDGVVYPVSRDFAEGYEVAHDSRLEYLGHGTVENEFENTTLPNRYSSTMSFSLGEEPYGVLFQSEDQEVPMS